MERRDFLGCAMLATLGAGTALAQATSEATTKTEPTKAPAKGIRITVLKTSVQEEFEKIRGQKIQPCERMKVGQEFTIEHPWEKPQGMCDWAWADIRAEFPYVYSGESPVSVACCTDGFRPVFFKLERLT